MKAFKELLLVELMPMGYTEPIAMHGAAGQLAKKHPEKYLYTLAGLLLKMQTRYCTRIGRQKGILCSDIRCAD